MERSLTTLAFMAFTIVMRAQISADTSRTMSFEDYGKQPVIEISQGEFEVYIISDMSIEFIEIYSEAGELLVKMDKVGSNRVKIPKKILSDRDVIVKLKTEAGVSRVAWKGEER